MVVWAAHTAVHTGSGHPGSGDDQGRKPAVGRNPGRLSAGFSSWVLRWGCLNLTGFTKAMRRSAFSPRHHNRSGGSGSFSLSEVREHAENSQLAKSIVHRDSPRRHELTDYSDRSEEFAVFVRLYGARVSPYCRGLSPFPPTPESRALRSPIPAREWANG